MLRKYYYVVTINYDRFNVPRTILEDSVFNYYVYCLLISLFIQMAL